MPRKAKKHSVNAAPGGRASADPVKMSKGMKVGKIGPNSNRRGQR